MSNKSVKTQKKKASVRKKGPETQADFYDRFVSHFLEQRNNTRQVQTANFILRWIKPGDNVFEIGCGIGDLSRLMAERGADVYAIDLSPKAIHWALNNQEAPGVEYVCDDVREMKNPERKFDAVVFSDSIEHIPAKDRRDVILKVGRWMNHPAKALVCWPHPTIHNWATKQTYQPVDERVEADVLLKDFRDAGFNKLEYVRTTPDQIYCHCVMLKVNEPDVQ